MVRETPLERRVREEFQRELLEEFKTPETQDEVRRVVTQTPPEVREQKLQQELQVNPDEEIAEQNTDKRMLTESPELVRNKLRYDGEHLLPDFDKYERKDTRPTWMRGD